MQVGRSETKLPFAWPTPKFDVGQVVRFAVPSSDDSPEGLRVRITARSVKEYMNNSTRVLYEIDWLGMGKSPEAREVTEELLEEVDL